jgi:hypothetical protein
MDNRKRWRRTSPIAVFAALTLAGTGAAHAAASSRQDGSSEGIATHPGCERLDARACLDLALTAMGGRDKLAAISNVQLDVIGHTALTEQSYRQAPFITSYERDQLTVDFDQRRLLSRSDAGRGTRTSAGGYGIRDVRGADAMARRGWHGRCRHEMIASTDISSCWR